MIIKSTKGTNMCFISCLQHFLILQKSF